MKRIFFTALLILGFFGTHAQAQQPCAMGLCPAVRAVVSDGLHSVAAFVAPQQFTLSAQPCSQAALFSPAPQAQPTPPPVFVQVPQVVVGSSQVVPQSMPCAATAGVRATPIRDWWNGRKRLFGGCQ